MSKNNNKTEENRGPATYSLKGLGPTQKMKQPTQKIRFSLVLLWLIDYVVVAVIVVIGGGGSSTSISSTNSSSSTE